MMLLLGLRELQWSRRRFAVAVLATALVFALGLLMSGVSASFDNEIDRTVDSFDADAWLLRSQSFGPFTGPATMPVERAQDARRLPGVRRADPVAVLRATTTTPSRRNVNLIGVVPGGVGAPRGWEGRVIGQRRASRSRTRASASRSVTDRPERQVACGSAR